MNLVKGALEFTTGNAAKHSYLITTPTAALGVRIVFLTRGRVGQVEPPSLHIFLPLQSMACG